MSRNPWKTLGSRQLLENPWFKVRVDDVIRPDGKPGLYNVVSASRVASGVIPLWPDGSVTLVGQYRYPIGEYSWEIPEGGGPLESDPQEIARRELKEETGLEAESWTALGRLHLSNCFFDEVCYLFLARDLTTGTASPEPSEVIETRRVSLQEAKDMAADGRITDAISVAAFHRLTRHIDRERRQRHPDYFQDMPEEYQSFPGRRRRGSNND